MTAPQPPNTASKSLASRVAQQLREAIIDSKFALGEMIPEETLARTFGVSRTPVREALNLLQSMGLVVVKPQRGSYVFETTETDVGFLCDFRCVMEPRAAELAFVAERAETVDAVQAAIDDMASAYRQKDAIQYSRADTRFHEAFVLHCGNPYLQAAYATAGARIAALRTHLSASVDVMQPLGIDQHRQMLALFSQGELSAFTELTRVHVNGTRASYIASLKAKLLA